MAFPFFTVGHSRRSLEELVALLRGAGVRLVVDVRKMPRSRANPQFNEDGLRQALAALGLSYEHLAALGGLRGKARNLPAEVNGLWVNRSFHNYADYALTAPFQEGLRRLRAEGRERPCAILCAEALWWRCHRRIIADYLLAAGETVFHIMGEGRLERAHLTPGAVVQSDATVVYPRTEGQDGLPGTAVP